MDSLTQIVLGGTLAAALVPQGQRRRALAYGDGMLVLMANDDAGIGAVEAIWQSAMLAGEPSGQLIAGMD